MVLSSSRFLIFSLSVSWVGELPQRAAFLSPSSQPAHRSLLNAAAFLNSWQRVSKYNCNDLPVDPPVLAPTSALFLYNLEIIASVFVCMSFFVRIGIFAKLLSSLIADGLM